jgi:hypothetical protein
VLVLLSSKQTLCCGTIANIDQHLYRIKKIKNIILIIISTKEYLEGSMLLNQER